MNNVSKTELIDSEYVILENIYDLAEHRTPLRQRELAQIAGTSLGMTNSILKRLARKGFITIKKLNSRNIRYAVTIEGINEILHRSYGYFKRTIRNAVFYRDSLDEIIHWAKRKNISTVLLVGVSDLDFIV
ncbi:MAG: MarR family transcriptional regulator, partial [Treponema sp.]|nr:MarR family transcriptional regulator [Treponema sp.]